MTFPNPSEMDPWFIDLLFAGLIMFVGLIISIVGFSAKRALKKLETFLDNVTGRLANLETRVTVIEVVCPKMKHQQASCDSEAK